MSNFSIELQLFNKIKILYIIDNFDDYFLYWIYLEIVLNWVRDHSSIMFIQRRGVGQTKYDS